MRMGSNATSATGSLDPGCQAPTSAKENPQCQDGVDNDGQPGLDFDGGASLNGGVPLGAADPQGTAPWLDREALPPGAGCGIGPELLLLGPLGWMAVRRARARRCAARRG